MIGFISSRPRLQVAYPSSCFDLCFTSPPGELRPPCLFMFQRKLYARIVCTVNDTQTLKWSHTCTVYKKRASIENESSPSDQPECRVQSQQQVSRRNLTCGFPKHIFSLQEPNTGKDSRRNRKAFVVRKVYKISGLRSRRLRQKKKKTNVMKGRKIFFFKIFLKPQVAKDIHYVMSRLFSY